MSSTDASFCDKWYIIKLNWITELNILNLPVKIHIPEEKLTLDRWCCPATLLCGWGHCRRAKLPLPLPIGDWSKTNSIYPFPAPEIIHTWCPQNFQIFRPLPLVKIAFDHLISYFYLHFGNPPPCGCHKWMVSHCSLPCPTLSELFAA